MTKEEILNEHYKDFDTSSGWMFDGPVSKVFEAMDQYAKQEAIELLKFVEKSRLTYRKTTDRWERWYPETKYSKSLISITSEELVNQFIQSKETT